MTREAGYTTRRTEVDRAAAAVNAINTVAVFPGTLTLFRVVSRSPQVTPLFIAGSIPGSSTERAADQRPFFVGPASV
jgi:hypothetical protein